MTAVREVALDPATLAERAVRSRRGQCRTDAGWFQWCNVHESRRPFEERGCRFIRDEEATAVEVLETSLPAIRAAIATDIEALVHGDDMLGGLLRHASNTAARTAVEAAAQVARGGAR